MARRNGNRSFKQKRNRDQHQRRRSSRGGRLISKLWKGEWSIIEINTIKEVAS